MTVTAPGRAVYDKLQGLMTLLRNKHQTRQWRERSDRRIASLDRFPFTLPYQIVGQEIVVVALAHTSRSPGYWARRR